MGGAQKRYQASNDWRGQLSFYFFPEQGKMTGRMTGVGPTGGTRMKNGRKVNTPMSNLVKGEGGHWKVSGGTGVGGREKFG